MSHMCILLNCSQCLYIFVHPLIKQTTLKPIPTSKEILTLCSHPTTSANKMAAERVVCYLWADSLARHPKQFLSIRSSLGHVSTENHTRTSYMNVGDESKGVNVLSFGPLCILHDWDQVVYRRRSSTKVSQHLCGTLVFANYED